MEEKALAEQTIGGTKSQDGDMNLTGTNRAEFNAGGDNHPADQATELQLREQDMALIENAKHILQQINRALEKLNDGTYGLSDRSHQPIVKERLEAIPYAAFTAEEQEIVEMS